MKKQEKGIMNSLQAQKASENGTLRNKLRVGVVALALSMCASTLAQNTSINSNTVPISGTDNAAYGPGSLNNSNSGTANTGYGKNTINQLSNGTYNAAFGVNSLKALTGGDHNVGVGYNAIQALQTGDINSALGSHALYSNTGHYNTGIGGYALYTNTSGQENSALGVNALYYNTANYNTAIGTNAMLTNSSGFQNCALGHSALYTNSTGFYNTACGDHALYSATEDWNTAIGTYAADQTTSGFAITAVGFAAMQNNTTGYENTGVGIGADVSPSSNFHNANAFGSYAICDATDKVRLGDVNVTDVEGQVAYSIPSDGRFKENISETDVVGLEFIKKLRPVVYNFNTKKFQEFLIEGMSDDAKKRYLSHDFSGSTAIRQSGFIAQEVEKAAQEVGYNFDAVHKPSNKRDNYSLSYSQFVVPLVKAVQEQQSQIETDSKTIADLQKQINELKEMIKQNVGTLNGATNTQNINVTDKNSVVLDQNVPNPFAESTTISYRTPETFSKAQMVITTIEGKVIKTVDITTKGEGRINIFASDLSSGIYMYSLIVDGKTMETKKLVKE